MNVALPPERLDILSICAGGGGLDLGVELAIPSARVVCMVEREAFAVATLVAAMEADLLAPAPVWSDVRTFDGRSWRGCVDGVIGGIPCQPHSLAGKRLGRNDARDLWSDARRIFVQSGAWFFLLENVGGMLTSGGAERVWRDFRRLGCAVEAGLFRASEVGTPHERERLFVLAVANRQQWQGLARTAPRERTGKTGPVHAIKALADADVERSEAWGPAGLAAGRAGRRALAQPAGCALDDAAVPGLALGICERADFIKKHASPERAGRLAVVDAAREPGRLYARSRQGRLSASDARGAGRDLPFFPPGPGDLDGWRAVLERAPELEPAVRRVADGVASRVDELRLLGNGVVPLQAAYALRTLASRLASRSAGAAFPCSLIEAAA